MFTKRTAVFLLVLGLALALCLACAAGEEGVTPGAKATPTEVFIPKATAVSEEFATPGGVLRLVGGEPPNWDAHRQHSYQTHRVLNFVHARLVTFKFGPKYDPWDISVTNNGLAESWEISSDALVYTFHLKKGVKWQDKPPVNGRELVAEDIKWTYEHLMNVKPTATYAWKLDAVSKIECPDKYTLVITLKEPRAPFLGFLADSYIGEILPREVEEKYGDFMKSETAIGAGPFMLQSYTPDVGQVYVKNPTYFRAKEGLPYVDEIRMMVLPDSSTTLAAFRAGNLDIRGISRLDLPSVMQTNPGINCYETAITASISHLTPRVDKPPYNDVRVRQAISMALNQQEIIDSLYLGYGVEMHGPINPASQFYLKDQGECAKYGKYNPEEARKLLAEAGYPNGFETTLNVSLGYGATYEEYAEYWADSLAKIGIKAKIKKVDYAGGVSVMATGKNEDLWWKYNYGDGLDPDEQVWQLYIPDSIKNWAKVNDSKLTELAEAQRKAKNDEERKRILAEFQRYEACQLNYIAWPQAVGITCMQPWVHNYRLHAASYVTGSIYEIVWVDQTSPTRKK